MKVINLSGRGIVTGKDALSYLKEVEGRKAVVVTGGSSMRKFGALSKVEQYLKDNDISVVTIDGIGKNPTIEEVNSGLAVMKDAGPDIVIAVGGGSAIDAMKAMVLFYEFPWLNFDNMLEEKLPALREKTSMIVIPSTSGTGSEVTRTAVITDTVKGIKVPIITGCLKPDIAILDPELTMTMPVSIAAETGMDALTHAIECYTRHDLDDFDEVLAKGAIEGLLEWLPVSCEEKTLESREKVHNYQCIAGISFTNVGVGVVHGIAHAFGAQYNMAHGLANAVILPFALDFNRKDPVVAKKLAYLSKLCGVKDIVKTIKDLKSRLNIPYCLKDTGLEEEAFLKDFDILVEHSMLGATRFNPVTMTPETMKKLINAVYYGKEVDF